MVLGQWERGWGSEQRGRQGGRGGHMPALAPMSKAELAMQALECLGCRKKARRNWWLLVQSLLGVLLRLFCNHVTWRRPAGNPGPHWEASSACLEECTMPRGASPRGGEKGPAAIPGACLAFTRAQ